jgi:hypothetical protein
MKQLSDAETAGQIKSELGHVAQQLGPDTPVRSRGGEMRDIPKASDRAWAERERGIIEARGDLATAGNEGELPTRPWPPAGTLVRHFKTGEHYRIAGYGINANFNDGRASVAYYSPKFGMMYHRDADNFFANDRFEVVPDQVPLSDAELSDAQQKAKQMVTLFDGKLRVAMPWIEWVGAAAYMEFDCQHEGMFRYMREFVAAVIEREQREGPGTR